MPCHETEDCSLSCSGRFSPPGPVTPEARTMGWPQGSQVQEDKQDLAGTRFGLSHICFLSTLRDRSKQAYECRQTYFDGSVTRGGHDVLIIKVHYIDSSAVADQDTT